MKSTNLMSRIGKKTIIIPENVDLKIDGNFVIAKGPKGELKQKLVPEIKLKFSDDKKELTVSVDNENIKKERSLWGTYRQLINNLILGVTEGFEKKLEINGVGYKAAIANKELVLNVGFSHPVNFKIPKNLEITTEKNVITIKGIDKHLVGETAAQIRKIKKPEPYKGKGIKYIDEVIRRKAGKQAKGVGA